MAMSSSPTEGSMNHENHYVVGSSDSFCNTNRSHSGQAGREVIHLEGPEVFDAANGPQSDAPNEEIVNLLDWEEPETVASLDRPIKGKGQHFKRNSATGIVIDLSQTWQRSLLRELNQLEENDICDKRVEENTSDRMLLGHADSRDFAIPMEDDFTIETDASSTVPSRLQMVHRMLPSRSEALFQDEEEDDMVGKPDPPSPKCVREERDALATDVLNELRAAQNTQRQIAMDHSSHPQGSHDCAMSHTAQDENPDIRRSRVFEGRLKQWDYDELGSGAEKASNQANCMCWGYGVLDFLLPPVQARPQYSTKARRSRVKQSAALEKVDEEPNPTYSTSRPEEQY